MLQYILDLIKSEKIEYLYQGFIVRHKMCRKKILYVCFSSSFILQIEYLTHEHTVPNNGVHYVHMKMFRKNCEIGNFISFAFYFFLLLLDIDLIACR